jgi:hypothetical protein
MRWLGKEWSEFFHDLGILGGLLWTAVAMLALIVSALPRPAQLLFHIRLREKPVEQAELTAIVKEYLPRFTLPNGKPPKVTIVAIRDYDCGGTVSAYSDGRVITLCRSTLKYPEDRLRRVILHELVRESGRKGAVEDGSRCPRRAAKGEG